MFSQFIDDDIEQNSNIKLASQIESMGTTDSDLMILIEELKSMVYKFDRTIRRCLLIIDQITFCPDKLKLAHALYVFQNQKRIQDNIFKERRKLNSILKRNAASEKPKISKNIILTRLDTKKQADQFVKHFNEKDLDCSKNKRKPISFRKNVI